MNKSAFVDIADLDPSLQYAIGLLTWNGGDPTQASSWSKTGPHFTSANGNYGTAHNG